MKAIDSRIRRLQARLCPDAGQEQRLWVAKIFGRELALDQDRCIEILGQCGFLPKTRFGVVSLCGIPHGLNAKELELYLQKNGTKTQGLGTDLEDSGPEGERQRADTSWQNHAQMSTGVFR